MKKKLFSILCFLLIGVNINAKVAKKPNIVIIIGDDCTYSDLSLYGGVNVKTPAIDQLAKEGLTFNKAYVTMSMCAPCRSELYTGLYPTNSGVCWNHARARQGTQSIVQHLAKFGYRTGLAGKTHIKPLKDVFSFEMIPGVERNCVSKTATYDPEGMRDFITRDKNQPFCIVVALTSPHAPWTVGDPSHFNPDELVLPPYMVDTKETRKEYAKYLAEIEVLDEQVGKTIQLLIDEGVYNETIVVFTSEQGSQFPYCKWTNYDNGVHTAFVVRWDGIIKAGTRTDALIQYNDVLPTLMDILGGEIDSFDGSSFLSVLKGETNKHRDYAYFMHNNWPEGPSYPIRSVTNGEFHYIKNLNSNNMYIEKHLMGRPDHTSYWPSWMLNVIEKEENFNIVSGYMLRPEEELYHTSSDKYERNNLVKEVKYAQIKNQLSDILKKWMAENNDPGADIDTKEAFEAQRTGDYFDKK